MKQHIENAVYGLLDYIAYPLALLLVAPILIRQLGPAAYGIFAFSMAVANTGAVIASGFGDANIQQVATFRAQHNAEGVTLALRCTLGIHLVLGTALMLVGLLFAPLIASRVAAGEPAALATCLFCLRVAAVLVLLRSIETVAVSTQRAFEAYGDAVRVSALFRVLSLLSGALLAWRRQSLASIFLAIAIVTLLSTVIQLGRITSRASFSCLLPVFRGPQLRAQLRFGGFTWLQSAAGVAFSQIDRILVGLVLGSVPVAAYSLASQLAQPIAGSTASSLHFLFPHFSARATTAGSAGIRRSVGKAVVCNSLLVTIEAGVLLVAGNWILRKWVGASIAQLDASVLPLLIVASALTALSVTGNYTMLALGRVRAATFVTIVAGCLMLLLAAMLLPRLGTYGMALARVAAGVASLFIYLPLRQLFSRHVEPGELSVQLSSGAPGVIP